MSGRLSTGMKLSMVMRTMSGANRGAYVAMQHILAADAGRGMIQLLDRYGIYGTDLYTLYNDKCQGLVLKLNTLLMATNMKLMSVERLKELSKDQMDKIHFTEEVCLQFETAMRKAHEQTQAQERSTNNKRPMGYWDSPGGG